MAQPAIAKPARPTPWAPAGSAYPAHGSDLKWDPLLVWISTLLGVVPFIGPLIYMLFRPPEYLDDIRERELEIKAMEKRLGGRDLHCPVCRAEVEEECLICPVCTTKLRQACANCHRPLEALWQVCPYCETPIEHDPATVTLAEAKRPPRRRQSR